MKNFAFIPACCVWSISAFLPVSAFTYDFADASQIAKRHSSWKISADGKSVLAAALPGVRTLALKHHDTGNRPYRLSFEARCFGIADPERHHWGMTLYNARRERFFIHTHWKSGWIYDVRNARKVKLEDGSGGKIAFARGASGSSPGWTLTELDCTEHGFTVRLGGKKCFTGETPLLGLTNLSFYAYGESVEIRNVRIEPLVLKPADPASGPTFRERGGKKGSWAVENAVNDRVGTVICWMRPEARTDQLVFRRRDGRVAARFSIYRYDWARAGISSAVSGVEETLFTRVIPNLRHRRDEWFHFAFTWDERGKGRFFINGLPFATGSAVGERLRHDLTGNALGEVAKIEIADTSVRDLTVWRRPLSGREIIADYRRTMPLDCVMVESLLPAGERAAAVFRLAPGGSLAVPSPVDALKPLSAKVTVATKVERLDGEGKWRAVPGGTVPERTIEVKGPVDLETARLSYPEGMYRLKVCISRPDGASPYVRHHIFTSAPRPAKANTERTRNDLKRGAVVFRTTFGGGREAGAGRGSRFFGEIPFPAEMLERPCLIEIDWPDDRARAMGFYMYEEGPASVRDHLQQGLIAGAEIPNSGEVQTQRYIFYPAATNYLFEARTLIEGRPAAVRELRVVAIDGALPPLRLNYPEGLPHRTFGHCDEDQTFDNNLTSARMGRPTPEVISRLAEYLAYTGQNAFYYSLTRYGSINHGFVEGADTAAVFPRRSGELREIVRRLKSRGVDFVPQNMYANDPSVARLSDIEGFDLRDGRALADTNGVFRRQIFIGRAPMDPSNVSAVRSYFKASAGAFADLSTNGVRRVLMCLGNPIASPLAWPSWEYGPSGSPEALRRRSDTVVRNVRAAARLYTRDNPDLRVTVEVPLAEAVRKSRGVDLARIAEIPNVDFAVIRHPTRHWWNLARKGRSGVHEDAYGSKAAEELSYLRRFGGGALSTVCFYPTYFESYTELPEKYRRRYGNGFQCIDAKPWGQHFLREFAFALAHSDMRHCAVGMQQLGSWGSEAAVREWTAAYCALPALAFEDVAGFSSAAVKTRRLKTKNGTYYYLVNTSASEQTVDAPFEKAVELSSEETVSGRAIRLCAYGLRSFLVRQAEAAAHPRWVNVAPLPPEHEQECAEDCRWLLENTVIDAHAFRFTLNPEGDPVADKAAALAPRFERVRRLMGEKAGSCGILFQATVGHGWASTNQVPPWQLHVRRDGSSEHPIFCPLDPRFLDYLRGQARQAARLRPAFFMVDDDTRFITGRDGCFCPLHIAEMKRRSGRDFSIRSLTEALSAGGEVSRMYDRLLEDTIARVVGVIREEFNRVDPAIPGSFCACCNDIRHAPRMAKMLAAPGQRPVIRINNGRYCRETARDFPAWLHKSALQLAALEDDTVVMTEPDTCPQNRYSMSARDLHAHISLSLLEGCEGGKIWITRMHSWEPESGRAYRKTLKAATPFYRELLRLKPRWEGIKIPMPISPPVVFETRTSVKNWGSAVLGRFGIPYVHTSRRCPVAALSAEEFSILGEADLRRLFEGVLLVDGDGAVELEKRGYKADGTANVVAFNAPLPDNARLGSPFADWYNETSKRRLTEALGGCGFSAPYYPGDAEILLRWGRSAAGERILAVFNSGHDDLDALPLVFPSGVPAKAERLQLNGSWTPVAVCKGENGEISIAADIRFLDPVVLKIN